MNAETLAGQIGVCSGLTQGAPSQFGSDGKNLDMGVAETRARECLDYNLVRLGDLVDTLDQSGLDTTAYRAQLATESVGISLELVEPEVFSTLVTGWIDTIRDYLSENGMDMLRRVDLEFGISYADEIDKAERVLSEVAADHERVLSSPETLVKVHSLGDSSVNLILRPWVKTADYWDVYWDLTREVKLRFDREGVSIPFPQMDVHRDPPGEAEA